MLPSNSIKVRKQQVFPFPRASPKQGDNRLPACLCQGQCLFAAPLAFNRQALTQRTAVLQKASQKSHIGEKAVGLKSSIPACARLGGEMGTRGWGRRVGAGQRRGRAQPTEARPSRGRSHPQSEDGRAIGHQRRADGRVLGTKLTARKTGWGQTGRWAGGRMGTSSPKSFQTTSNKAKRNERTRKTHQTVPAEAELGSELSCASFETEQAFCRRFLQGTRAQANTNRSLPLQ